MRFQNRFDSICDTRVSPNFVGEEWNFMHLRNNELIPICQCPLHSMDFKAKPLFCIFLLTHKDGTKCLDSVRHYNSPIQNQKYLNK